MAAARPTRSGTGSGSPARARGTRTQGKRTKRRLLDAGLRTFRDRGYQAARVDDIVRAARTSHGTFYLYFSNKEDLLRTLAVECATEIRALGAELGPVTPDEAGFEELARFVREFLTTYRRYGPVVRVWMEDQAKDRRASRLGVVAFTAMATALAARMEESGPTPGTDPDRSVGALMAMLERLAYATTSRRFEIDDDGVATIARLMHRGFFGAPVFV